MFNNLTLNQLFELQAALWEHYDLAFADYSKKIQALETGSEDMNAAMSKWEEKRDSIKAMQAEVAQEISKHGPKARRVRHAE